AAAPLFRPGALPGWPGPRRDLVDGGLQGLPGVGAQRGGAGLVGRDLLALLADHVGQEALGEVGVGLVLVLHARHLVADQHDRVGVGLVGGVVELDRVVVLGVGLAGRGGVHDGGRGLGAVGDELVPDADRGGAQLAGVRGVHVADGALAALDGGDHTGGARGGRDGLDRPVAADLVRPGVARGLGEVGDEVLGGARLVGAVHRDDVGGG